ncbi:predicted transcription regulator, containing DNA-binding HTH domain [Thermococcus kodakarensis KOD1]|uniref:Putative HTH-type transcriptional regulatory protein TK0539 n=1 Tax=Thermococcus kodakarensis (strain ATCC BAA-918 / JCM 12380 / KOD1) TaxID=69014 RepID=Y539_THEKO|nr:transcriptional regulator [Thermococcus kodakarensis]Q5JF28.1 RecName: Full=Putative HTH-type transcriptional regulatory protein TK0539 [Thermococcus kodakarensis KOD1]WCN28592.1 transcriptional regulator [Thermococcus kodakarensis]WCN30889.1 transcriptional regulator [Thermococcus kodakarensis]BAD84728.1 predicted transcription regulator, containing DNA-binding HTH domain [Thermococcus kodakarensis KOD1]
MERERLIKTVEAILRGAGYRVARLDLKGSCFDLVASRLFLLLFIKATVNIDTITEEQAEDLKRLAKFFKASPLIVGLRSKSGELEEGVVYERFGIYALRPETLYDALLNNELPAVFAERGGLYVRINGELLRELREKHGYSVNELAQLLGVSRKSLLNYERGEQAVSLDVAIQLEEIFDEALAEPIDILRAKVEADLNVKPETPLEREVFERLKKLGLGLVKVKKAPFNAISTEDDIRLLTGIDERKTRSTIKRAEMVAEVGRIVNSGGVFILEKTKAEVVSEVPLIPKESLEEVKDADELIELIDKLKKEIKEKLFS